MSSRSMSARNSRREMEMAETLSADSERRMSSMRNDDAVTEEFLGRMGHRQNEPHNMVMSWGCSFMWFFLIFVLFWVILFSFRPNFVLLPGADKNNVDSLDYAKIFWYSLLFSLIVLLLCYLICRIQK